MPLFSMMSENVSQEEVSSSIPWWVYAIVTALLFIVAIIWQLQEDDRRRSKPGLQKEKKPEPITIDEAPAEKSAEKPGTRMPKEAPQRTGPERLRKLEGIGPKVEALLHGNGILTFDQLAGTSLERLDALLDEAGYAYMDATTWPEQARFAAADDWDGLAELQGQLKGGRKG